MFKAGAILCLLIVSSPVWGEDVRSAIDARNKEWTDAFNRGDYESVLAIYDEGFTAIPSGAEPITDRSEFRAVLKDAVSSLKDMKFVTDSLKVRGRYAYELGRSTYLAKSEDGKWSPAGDEYLVVWKKDDHGVWNYHVDTWWSSE